MFCQWPTSLLILTLILHVQISFQTQEDAANELSEQECKTLKKTLEDKIGEGEKVMDAKWKIVKTKIGECETEAEQVMDDSTSTILTWKMKSDDCAGILDQANRDVIETMENFKRTWIEDAWTYAEKCSGLGNVGVLEKLIMNLLEKKNCCKFESNQFEPLATRPEVVQNENCRKYKKTIEEHIEEGYGELENKVEAFKDQTEDVIEKTEQYVHENHDKDPVTLGAMSTKEKLVLSIKKKIRQIKQFFSSSNTTNVEEETYWHNQCFWVQSICQTTKTIEDLANRFILLAHKNNNENKLVYDAYAEQCSETN